MRTVNHVGRTLYVGTDEGDLFACDPEACAAGVRLLAHETALDDVFRLYRHAVTADARAVHCAARDPMPDGGGASRITRVAR